MRGRIGDLRPAALDGGARIRAALVGRQVRVERSRAAQSGFGTISETVREVSEIVGMVDRQTEGIAHSTSMIQTSVDRVKAGLTEFSGDAPADDVKYDLLYTELAVWEPIAEARRLLGPQGLASGGGPLMTMALDELARAENWNQARARLHEIHRIAHYDLPLVPLWQTANYFAYRKSLDGIGDTPMTLYQNLDSWRKEFE